MQYDWNLRRNPIEINPFMELWSATEFNLIATDKGNTIFP